jgi:ribonucleoside-diphosphate reductase alpha chain
MTDAIRDALHARVVPTVPEINLTENSRTILSKRYLMRGEDGQPTESVNDMFFRVAYNVSKPYCTSFAAATADASEAAVAQSTEAFYRLLTSKRFFPAFVFTGNSFYWTRTTC